MQYRTLQKALSIGCLMGAPAVVLGIFEIPRASFAQNTVPAYNPYPPGILPSDLDSEIARVQREMGSIFKEALGEWKALPPPTVAGQPPTLQFSGYDAVEILGKLLNFDLNILAL